MSYSFRWDPRKAVGNRKKHKVSFDEAATVFTDPLALTWYDENHSVEEDRYLMIGHSIRERILIVSYTTREHATIRIISARLATPNECRNYEENQDYNP